MRGESMKSKSRGGTKEGWEIWTYRRQKGKCFHPMTESHHPPHQQCHPRPRSHWPHLLAPSRFRSVCGDEVQSKNLDLHSGLRPPQQRRLGSTVGKAGLPRTMLRREEKLSLEFPPPVLCRSRFSSTGKFEIFSTRLFFETSKSRFKSTDPGSLNTTSRKAKKNNCREIRKNP